MAKPKCSILLSSSCSISSIKEKSSIFYSTLFSTLVILMQLLGSLILSAYSSKGLHYLSAVEASANILGILTYSLFANDIFSGESQSSLFFLL